MRADPVGIKITNDRDPSGTAHYPVPNPAARNKWRTLLAYQPRTAAAPALIAVAAERPHASGTFTK